MNLMQRIILTTFVISMLSSGMIVLPSYAITDSQTLPPTISSIKQVSYKGNLDDGKKPVPTITKNSQTLPPTIKNDLQTLPPTIKNNSQTLPPTIKNNSQTLPPTIKNNSQTLPPTIQPTKQVSYKGNLDDGKKSSTVTKVLRKNP